MKTKSIVSYVVIIMIIISTLLVKYRIIGVDENLIDFIYFAALAIIFLIVTYILHFILEKEQIQENEIKKSKKSVETFRPFAKNWLELTKLFPQQSQNLDAKIQLEQLKCFFAKHTELKNHTFLCDSIYKKLEDAENSLASYQVLKTIQKDVTIPFKERLQIQEHPLSEQIKHQNLMEMIKIATICYDFVDTSTNSLSTSDLQRLNIDLVMGRKSPEKVYSMAKVATYTPDETPRWIRSVKSSVDCLKSTGENIEKSSSSVIDDKDSKNIISGYIL